MSESVWKNPVKALGYLSMNKQDYERLQEKVSRHYKDKDEANEVLGEELKSMGYEVLAGRRKMPDHPSASRLVDQIHAQRRRDEKREVRRLVVTACSWEESVRENGW